MKTIHIPNEYWLLVDEHVSESEGYWIYLFEDGTPDGGVTKSNLPTGWFDKLHDRKNYWRPIGHLPITGPELEGVPLLPELPESDRWKGCWVTALDEKNNVNRTNIKRFNKFIQSLQPDWEFVPEMEGNDVKTTTQNGKTTIVGNWIDKSKTI